MNMPQINRSGLCGLENRVLKKIVRLALEEDRVTRDVTTGSLRGYDRVVEAVIIAKDEGVISGVAACRETFRMVDSGIRLMVLKSDGDAASPDEVVIRLDGRESSILKAERTALNFLQRLSGVATATRKYVNRVKSSGIVLLDTRKTTPGMRYLEKKAVRDGGGNNHRMNLEEMALIKDNHIRMAGTIGNAVRAVKKRYPGKKIEVEVKDLGELKEALSMNIDMIMLDNFTSEMVGQAVILKRAGVQFEVSGNINLENIESRLHPGIDFISVGALTHSFKSMDLSLEILEKTS
jgi:nicotinate-nucleotide pyrophosphorylase (carboxylating)